jgi:hypothetical protein
VTSKTIEALAIHAQVNAAWHAAQAMRARNQGNLQLACHMQRLARMDYDYAWQHLVSLMTGEPII